jgi:glutamate 5-kinase
MPRHQPQIPVSPIVVVKIGSAVLAPEGALEPASIDRLAADIARAARSHRLVIVSSGAVASGFGAMGLAKPPKEIMLKQAAAAVGQSRLMRAWSDAFARHGITVAQVLLTADDLDHRARHLNARNTLLALLERAIVPIINENDSVAFDEIKLGDNDRLSSLVAGLVGARQLLILSTAHGLYEHGNSKKILPIVTDLAAAREHVSGGTSSVGTGGMHTKLDGCRGGRLDGHRGRHRAGCRHSRAGRRSGGNVVSDCDQARGCSQTLDRICEQGQGNDCGG